MNPGWEFAGLKRNRPDKGFSGRGSAVRQDGICRTESAGRIFRLNSADVKNEESRGEEGRIKTSFTRRQAEWGNDATASHCSSSRKAFFSFYKGGRKTFEKLPLSTDQYQID